MKKLLLLSAITLSACGGGLSTEDIADYSKKCKTYSRSGDGMANVSIRASDSKPGIGKDYVLIFLDIDSADGFVRIGGKVELATVTCNFNTNNKTLTAQIGSHTIYSGAYE